MNNKETEKFKAALKMLESIDFEKFAKEQKDNDCFDMVEIGFILEDSIEKLQDIEYIVTASSER